MPHKDLAVRREWQWKRNLRRRYNMTPEEYFVLYEKQGGACALCNRKPDIFHRGLHVDHNHKTGKVRGLLCCPCNRNLLGFVEKTGMIKVVKYLKKGSKL